MNLTHSICLNDIFGICINAIFIIVIKKKNHNSKPIKSKHVLVTGATSGLGRAVAHSYSKTCGTLILVGRSGDKLEEVKAECKKLNSRCNIKMVVADMLDTAVFSQKMKEVAENELVGFLNDLVTNRWIWLLQRRVLLNLLLAIRETNWNMPMK